MNLTVRNFTGFTLAELLIALAILGVIATFTIPKVLQAQNDTRRAAVYKETISAVQSAVHALVISGDIATRSHTCGTPSPASRQAIIDQLNYVKKVNCGAECDRLFFANGSTVVFGKGNILDFLVDANGPNEGPGAWGEDMLYFHYNDCNGTDAGIAASHFGPSTGVPAAPADRTKNFALWTSLFAGS